MTDGDFGEEGDNEDNEDSEFKESSLFFFSFLSLLTGDLPRLCLEFFFWVDFSFLADLDVGTFVVWAGRDNGGVGVFLGGVIFLDLEVWEGELDLDLDFSNGTEDFSLELPLCFCCFLGFSSMLFSFLMTLKCRWDNIYF